MQPLCLVTGAIASITAVHNALLSAAVCHDCHVGEIVNTLMQASRLLAGKLTRLPSDGRRLDFLASFYSTFFSADDCGSVELHSRGTLSEESNTRFKYKINNVFNHTTKE